MSIFGRQGYQPSGSVMSPPSNPPNQGGAGQKPNEIRFLGDMQRLSLKEGDRLVLTLAHPITQEVAEHIMNSMEGVFPGHKIIVLEPGMTLGVIGIDEESSF